MIRAPKSHYLQAQQIPEELRYTLLLFQYYSELSVGVAANVFTFAVVFVKLYCHIVPTVCSDIASMETTSLAINLHEVCVRHTDAPTLGRTARCCRHFLAEGCPP